MKKNLLTSVSKKLFAKFINKSIIFKEGKK